MKLAFSGDTDAFHTSVQFPPEVGIYAEVCGLGLGDGGLGSTVIKQWEALAVRDFVGWKGPALRA